MKKRISYKMSHSLPTNIEQNLEYIEKKLELEAKIKDLENIQNQNKFNKYVMEELSDPQSPCLESFLRTKKNGEHNYCNPTNKFLNNFIWGKPYENVSIKLDNVVISNSSNYLKMSR